MSTQKAGGYIFPGQICGYHFCFWLKAGAALSDFNGKEEKTLPKPTYVLSLFFIGGTLVGLPFRGIGRRILFIVIGKLIFHPIAVFITILLLPLAGLPALDPSMTRAAVILAAVPMLSIYSILALKYGQEEICSAAMLPRWFLFLPSVFYYGDLSTFCNLTAPHCFEYPKMVLSGSIYREVSEAITIW